MQKERRLRNTNMKQVNRYLKRYRAVSLASGMLVSAVGAVVLVGWIWNISVLMSLSNGTLVTMKVNTALAFMLSGLALVLKGRHVEDKERLGKGRRSLLVIADAFGMAVLLVGALTLCEYLFGWNLKIDNFLIKEAPGAVLTLYPGRMAPTTAIIFILAGIALIFLDTETRSGQKPAQYLVIIGWWVALIALVGYFFYIPMFFSGFGKFTAMALHTTILFLILTVGILFSRSNSGIVKILSQEGIAGQMIRHILPIIFGAPLFLTWLIQLGERKELFSDLFGDVLVTVGSMLIITIILWRNATVIAEKESTSSRTEEALRESKALVDAVVENVPLMIFLKEATDLRFVIFNRAGEELLGYDRKLLLGKNNLDLFPPEQAAHFMAKDREVLDGETGVLDIPEEPILTAKKGQRLLHTRKVCIRGADGTTKFLLGISEDITEWKQMEEERNSLQEQLIRSEKLAAVGELISGVVHEINNPLTGMKGLAELLMNETQDEEKKKDLKFIYQSSERIEKIVKNLQRFARREEPIRKNVNINELIDIVISIRNYEMEARNIKVERHYQPDLTLLLADPSQLEQVFLNLIINAEYAIHETGKAGTLTIATSAGLDHADGKTVVIEFSDTGTGIPNDVLPKIFNPFFTTKGVGKGTGLGLSVSYGIIKEHGGEISARNRAEGGAVFTIKLPVQGGGKR